MQSYAMLRIGQPPSLELGINRKVMHTSRFTAVKDSRNRKVRGLWRRGEPRALPVSWAPGRMSGSVPETLGVKPAGLSGSWGDCSLNHSRVPVTAGELARLSQPGPLQGKGFPA